MKKLSFKQQDQAFQKWRFFKRQQQGTFGFTEPGLPTIPSAVMWQNVLAGLAAAQSGTLTAGATTCTSMTATNGLTVGMGISGTGVVSGTVIAAIVSGTAITLSLAATVTGTPTLTFTLNDPNQSIWGGQYASGQSFPAPPGSAIATDTPDCPFNIPDAQVLAAGALYTPSPGRGVLVVAAGATTAPAVQYNIAGTWTSVLTFPVSSTSSAYIMADGVNVRYNNLASANSTFTFYRERSSKSSSI
jgi:hypothetical protein